MPVLMQVYEDCEQESFLHSLDKLAEHPWSAVPWQVGRVLMLSPAWKMLGDEALPGLKAIIREVS